MKKILFDGMSLQSANEFAGGSEYSKEILHALCAGGYTFDVVYNPKRKFPVDMQKLCEAQHIKRIICTDRKKIPGLLDEGHYDVFFSGVPYEYNKVNFPQNVRFVYTIHGLRNIETPIDRYFLNYGDLLFKSKTIIKIILNFAWKKGYLAHQKKKINDLLNASQNRKIFTDSYHSKYSILNHFPSVDVGQIDVFYAPMSEFVLSNAVDETVILNHYGLQAGKYILMLSCNRPEKNCYRGALALRELFAAQHSVMEEIKVVMLGAAHMESIEKIGRQYVGKFILAGYVEKMELEVLMKNAHLMLYPTLNEGFGYPPINAMKYGTLSACSAISSVTEACGDAVLYFNPFDIQEMKVRILESFDENIRREKQSQMIRQYEKIKALQLEATTKITAEIAK